MHWYRWNNNSLLGIELSKKSQSGMALKIKLFCPYSLPQCIKLAISLSIMFSYALQFHVPVAIMWPVVARRYEPLKYPVFAEILFRTAMCFCTCKLFYCLWNFPLEKQFNIHLFICIYSCSGWSDSISGLLHFLSRRCEQYSFGTAFPTDSRDGSHLAKPKNEQVHIQQRHSDPGDWFPRLHYWNIWKHQCPYQRVPKIINSNKWTKKRVCKDFYFAHVQMCI